MLTGGSNCGCGNRVIDHGATIEPDFERRLKVPGCLKFSFIPFYEPQFSNSRDWLPQPE
jgi:hypothetical protein